MTDLINRLAGATGADRELFEHVIKQLKPACWEYLDANHLVVSDTRSRIQKYLAVGAWESAALALVGEVLPGWKWSVNRLDYGYTASVKPPLKTQGDLELQDLGEMAAHPTNPAIALLIALLKAKD